MSSNKLLRQIFESELSTNGVKMANNKKVIMTPRSSLRVRTYNLITLTPGKLCYLFLPVHTENRFKDVIQDLFPVSSLSSSQAQADKRKQMPTLSGQFRQSLDSLMKALSSCQPFFIRCFKPNNDKQSEASGTF